MSEQAAPASLLAALLAAQSEFPEIPKDRENTFFHSKYSTLDAILTATRPALNKYGIIVDNFLSLMEGRWHVVGRLTFAANGEERTNPYPLPINFDALSPQARGSEITYGRRYSLAPMLGITSDEDDDGNAATAGHEKDRKRERREPSSKQEQERPSTTAPGGEPTTQAQTVPQMIAACATAAVLAKFLQEMVGKYPVAKHAAKWPKILELAEAHIKQHEWPQDQLAMLAAVTEGIRAELTPAKGDSSKAPALERICGWIDQQETPADLLRVMIDIRDGARFVDLRADPQRVSDICVHALRFVKSKVDLKDWTDESVDAVCNEIDAIDAHYQLELQANATFGGGNEG